MGAPLGNGEQVQSEERVLDGHTVNPVTYIGVIIILRPKGIVKMTQFNYEKILFDCSCLDVVRLLPRYGNVSRRTTMVWVAECRG